MHNAHAPSRRGQQLFQMVQRQAQVVLSQGGSVLDAGAEADDPKGALLYLGNVHDAVPRGLLYDPLLEPVEQVVWQAIRIHAGQQGAGQFPSVDSLRPITKCGKTRLSWAIHILRLTRWVSICPVRDARGHVRGRVYALHDERADLADAMLLDPRYVETVQRYCSHRNPGVAKVARTVRAELGLWLEEDSREVGQLGDEASRQLERRLKEIDQRLSGGRRNTGFGTTDRTAQLASKPKVQDLKSGFFGDKKPKSQDVILGNESAPKVQNITSGPLLPLSSSCSNSNKPSIENYSTTTTTVVQETVVHEALEWPERVSNWIVDENTRRLLTQLAENLPPGVGQRVFDEVAGVMAEKVAQGNPIGNPAAYLRAVLMAAKRGEFMPTSYASLGREERLGIERQLALITQPHRIPRGQSVLLSGSIVDRLTDRSWADDLINQS